MTGQTTADGRQLAVDVLALNDDERRQIADQWDISDICTCLMPVDAMDMKHALRCPVVANPVRIQRQRTKGWRMPRGAVAVSRPGRFGNPFKGEVGAATSTRQMLADQFQWWVMVPTVKRGSRPEETHNNAIGYLGVPFEGRVTVAEIRAKLAGRDLACWCPLDQPCHADVLLRLANSPRPLTFEQVYQRPPLFRCLSCGNS